MVDLFNFAARMTALPVRHYCPFRGRKPSSWNAGRRNASKHVERETEQLIHMSTPFGRIALVLSESSNLQAASLPEGTSSLPQDPIDDPLVSL